MLNTFSTFLKGVFSVVSWILVTAAVVTGTIWCWNARRPDEISRAPGVLIRDEPIQLDYAPSPLTEITGWQLTKLATFHIHGRVLGLKRYGDDRSTLSPVDVVLGWGPMSDTEVLQKLKITQGMRMYFYEFDGNPPIPEGDIITHSANIHIIPADVEVASFVTGLRIGELVNLRGSLVAASAGEVTWRSSLTRWDVGINSSELLYTTYAQSLSGRNGLVAEEIGQGGMEEARSSLQSWYELLLLRRRALDVRDQKAVRAFNEEARRYMTLAHPGKHPGALSSPIAPPATPALPEKHSGKNQL